MDSNKGLVPKLIFYYVCVYPLPIIIIIIIITNQSINMNSLFSLTEYHITLTIPLHMMI